MRKQATGIKYLVAQMEPENEDILIHLSDSMTATPTDQMDAYLYKESSQKNLQSILNAEKIKFPLNVTG